MFSEVEQVDCAQFMIAAGLYAHFFKQMKKIAADGGKFPWAQFAEALGRGGVRPGQAEIEAILKGAETQNAVHDLLKSFQLDVYDRTFGERRGLLRGDQAKQLTERKQALKEKLMFMRANRLFEEEAKVLEEFQALFPDEQELAGEREAFQIRWAREVVANSASVTDLTSDLQWKVDALSEDQLTVKSVIVQRAIELATEKPRLAHDLAVSLHMMDFNAEALQVLERGAPTHANDWLRLELMIQARQFVNALEESSRLEVKYASEPEAAFAVVYARARALKGLGQNAQAVDLLRSLVRIRPHYKSAHSLLLDWTGGEA